MDGSFKRSLLRSFYRSSLEKQGSLEPRRPLQMPVSCRHTIATRAVLTGKPHPRISSPIWHRETCQPARSPANPSMSCTRFGFVGICLSERARNRSGYVWMVSCEQERGSTARFLDLLAFFHGIRVEVPVSFRRGVCSTFFVQGLTPFISWMLLISQTFTITSGGKSARR